VKHQTRHSPDRHRDLFSRATLELTFRMLRHTRPGLALTLRNALLAHPPRQHGSACAIKELPLPAEQIDAIVDALGRMSHGGQARAGGGKPEVVLVRSLLLDWMMIARQQIDSPALLNAAP
jgi:hypothetical protein